MLTAPSPKIFGKRDVAGKADFPSWPRVETPRLGRSFGAEGAATPDAETPSGIDGSFARWPAFGKLLFIALGLFLGFSLPTMEPLVFQWQSAVSALVVTAPLGLLAAFALFRVLPTPRGNPFRAFAFMIILLLLTALVSAAAFLILNQSLDRAPALQRAYVVQNKWVARGGSHGRRIMYRAGIDVDDFGAPPLFSEKLLPVRRPNHVAVEVYPSDFGRIAPGRSRLVMTLHSGRFGIPWMSRTSLIP